jgi:Kunitz/Bovine pancreatic trypsin inhibitor domain
VFNLHLNLSGHLLVLTNFSARADDIDICTLDPVNHNFKKSCKALFRAFTYDSALGQCKEFTYGGCHGTANNFGTLEECQEACENKE